MILDVKKNIFFGILLSLITFLFMFIPGFKVKAEEVFSFHDINELELFDHEITEDYLYSAFDIDKNTYPYVFLYVRDSSSSDYLDKNTYHYLELFFSSNNKSVSPTQDGNSWRFNGGYTNSFQYFVSSTFVKFYTFGKSDITRLSLGHVKENGFMNYASSCFYYFSNYDIVYRDTGEIAIPSSKPKKIDFNYQYDKKRGPLDKLYSIDYIFDSNTFTSDTAIQYEINYIDEYEKYSDENISSYLYLNGFKFYGLVNDDGLYHWEELDNTSNSYVDDYEDYYQDGKYYFNVKKMNLDLTNYEKIIFRSIFFNDNYLESAVTRSNNEKISRDDVFYNTVFGPTYLNMQFDTKEFFYLNITSTLSEYKSRWYTWDYSDSDPYKQPYLNYFDLTTSQFVSESHGLPLYYANDLNYDFIEKHDVVIGTSTNKGVAITEEFKKRSVAGLVFTYREQFTYNVIFEFKDLYFSYNNTNDNEKKIYIDKDGNRYQDDGVKASNTNVEQFEGTNALENITDFLNDLRLTSDYFNYNFELNWNKLPGNIQGLILFVFNMSCILVILRIGGYK